jgi:pilus assembly protein Flp/PilA
MVNHVMNFVNDEEGATAIEYGLLAALIAAVIIGSVSALGTRIDSTFVSIEAAIAGGS